MKLQDNIAEEFDAFSENYSNDMVACVPYYLELLSGFTNNLPKNFVPKQILDLGCGNGNVTNQLVRKFPKAHFSLLDASDKMLELCEKRFNNYRIDTIKSYFHNYDFRPHYFDMVVAGFSLHHCNQDEKKSLFKSIYETLKADGVFACSDLMINKTQKEHPQHIMDWSRFVLENFPNNEKWDWLMEHYNEYDNPDNLNNQLLWLKEAGFSDFNVTVHDNYWIHLKAFKK